MYRILEKDSLNATVTRMKVDAPDIAKAAKAGQFVILRVDKESERIPLTIADFDRIKGTVDIIFQIVGATTFKLNKLKKDDYIEDFVGPLGNATCVCGIKEAAVIGGGVGCAIAYPIVKGLQENSVRVDSIIGFRNKDLVILEKEFDELSNRTFKVSDDGSFGEKGLVTDVLRRLIEQKTHYDTVYAIGPLVMMKFVSLLTLEYGIKTIVSMNPIMIDGTGMCGGCRLSVLGKTKFACVDGPDFDGHTVDFDQAINRANMYKEFERQAYKKECNLFRCKGEL